MTPRIPACKYVIVPTLCMGASRSMPDEKQHRPPRIRFMIIVISRRRRPAPSISSGSCQAPWCRGQLSSREARLTWPGHRNEWHSPPPSPKRSQDPSDMVDRYDCGAIILRFRPYIHTWSGKISNGMRGGRDTYFK